MNQVTKKIMTALLSIVMVFSVITVSPTNAATAKTVTFTIERLTIGQGFYIEPLQVEVQDGDTAKTVFDKVIQSIGGTYTASSEYGFYLQSINGADTGIVNIPQEISLMPEYKYSYTDDEGAIYEFGYKAPTNTENDGNSAKPALGEGAYNAMSGWMFTINNASAIASADQIKVSDGDVIRLQFSVYGYGADLGYDTESYTGIPKQSMANKDSLIKEIGAVNANKTYWMAYPNVKAAYDNAMIVLNQYNPTQQSVDAALNTLSQAEKTPTYPTVKRASIKSIKNIKGRKVKIKVKKIAGAEGYQYKYATNKKLKNAKTKTTTKRIFTTKKFKKKKKCYVKVRGYIKVNGTNVYGKWSKRKSVKIKK